MAVIITDVTATTTNEAGDNSHYGHDDQVKFELRGEEYERFGAGSRFHKTYEGPAWEVVQAIAKAHSYFQFDDMTLEEIKVEYPTIADMIKELDSSNGDGCDYIDEWIDVNTKQHVIESSQQ